MWCSPVLKWIASMIFLGTREVAIPLWNLYEVKTKRNPARRQKNMNRRVVIGSLVVVMLAGVMGVQAQTLNGAGASFPFPIYSKWAFEYEKVTSVKLNYQSIGSGGGIAQIKAKTVNFGASDAPLEVDELNEFGLVQFPMIVGGVVPVVNLREFKDGEIRISQKVLADIYLGKVTQWNDPAIQAINPGKKMPKRKITVVHRSDGSGTTWIFTNFLAKVSKEWKEKVDFGKAVPWPAGVGGKGNEGVSVNVKRIPGSIGYVEYAYAITNKLSTVLLENQAGQYVGPTIESFQAACASADWKNAPGYYMVLTDQPGENSWPITGASYILVHKEQPDAANATTMLKFFDWCFTNGQKAAIQLHYVPIPSNVVDMVEETWKTALRSDGQAVWK
jgi:phosphate transport system substrate-binding protein